MNGPYPRHTIPVSCFDIAQRYVGIGELDRGDHPLIQWWLSLCGLGLDQPDETPWCSAFMQHAAWELRRARTKSAAARSWLSVGEVVSDITKAEVGFDVVILKRGGGNQPGPEVTSGAPGHVGWFAGFDRQEARVLVLGGNQGDSVSIAPFPLDRILGIRRI